LDSGFILIILLFLFLFLLLLLLILLVISMGALRRGNHYKRIVQVEVQQKPKTVSKTLPAVHGTAA
jgi:Na+-transporting methylmalonyl-CoA/oxaloacetate decarboxylase gamma subunit